LGLLKWSQAHFSAKSCAEYPPVAEHRADAAVSAAGELIESQRRGSVNESPAEVHVRDDVVRGIASAEGQSNSVLQCSRRMFHWSTTDRTWSALDRARIARPERCAVASPERNPAAQPRVQPAEDEIAMRVLWCVAVLAIGIAQGQERQPGQGVNSYTRDKEIALGQQLALEFRQKTTPLGVADASDYVSRVGANLAAQFPGGWTYRIETVREDQGGPTLEPTAFPGGPIFVSVDLIVAARNEAEFAGMLAHAMAHVVARHWTRSATKSALITGDSSGPGASPKMPMGMLAFQRGMEREADYLAVKAMAAAGYDPSGLASYLGRVQAARSSEAVFDSLPPRDQRVAAIQSEVRKLPAGAYRAGDEFARVQAEIK
jgi:hypothetical protein